MTSDIQQESLNQQRGRSRSNSISNNIVYGEFASPAGRDMEDAHMSIKVQDEDTGINCFFFAVFDGESRILEVLADI